MEYIKLGKYTVLFPNKKEYLFLKKEIWNQDIYYFESKKDSPFIIDIGSHIGISLLYFKSIYPNSNILAFEPNPISFEILKENISINKLEDIQLIDKAISSKNGNTTLYIDNTGSNWESNSSLIKGSWSGKENTKPINVQCSTLHSYLKDIVEIDMFKIDTEGTELNILKNHIDILQRVLNISIEYHPNKNSKLNTLVSILKKYFDIDIYHEGKLLKKIEDGKMLTIKGKKRKKS